MGWDSSELEDSDDPTAVMVIPDFFQEALDRLRRENQAFKERIKEEEDIMERVQQRINIVVTVVSVPFQCGCCCWCCLARAQVGNWI